MTLARTPVYVPPKLSAIERDIVTLLAAGLTHHEIGEALGYARHTMRNRVSGIYQRVGVRGSASLVAWALMTGNIRAQDVQELWAQRCPQLANSFRE